MSAGALAGQVDWNNTHNTALGIGGTFTGTPSDVSKFASVTLSCKTDQAGILYAEFSVDGTNWDSILSFEVAADTNEVHRLTVSKKFFRARFTNSSGVAQTYIRLQSIIGNAQALTSSINSTIQQDADGIVVRSRDLEFDIAQGKVAGYSIVNKSGKNFDIDTATVPEDIWNGGGAYTGFPTGSPETLQFFSSSASDTGTLRYTYLATSSSTDWQTATVTLNGTTPVSGVSAYRVHTASYSSGSATAFNVGTITCRHSTTTANVFFVMPVGTSQTYVAAYTVPAGSTGYIREVFCSIQGSASAYVDGALWIRTLSGSPRLRRNFTSALGASHRDEIYGGLVLPAGTDVIPRITVCSANNIAVIAGYDLVLVED